MDSGEEKESKPEDREKSITRREALKRISALCLTVGGIGMASGPAIADIYTSAYNSTVSSLYRYGKHTSRCNVGYMHYSCFFYYADYGSYYKSNYVSNYTSKFSLDGVRKLLLLD